MWILELWFEDATNKGWFVAVENNGKMDGFNSWKKRHLSRAPR